MIDPSKLEEFASDRLQALLDQDHRRALFVAVLQSALTSVARGASDRDGVLEWVNDEADTLVTGFAATVEALNEDVHQWRAMFDALRPRPRGRQLSAEVCDAIASADDPEAFMAFNEIPRPDDATLALILARRYGRRRRAA